MTRLAAPDRWDDAYDVIVVGFGYAGGVAAIEAHDAGARVLLLEKMPDPGGLSICSAGGVRITDDVEAARDYLEATNGGTAPTAVLEPLARGMAEVADYIAHLARVNGATVRTRTAPGNYPFPGHRSLGFVFVEDVPGFDPRSAYPAVRGSPRGARLFKVVADNVDRRAIAVRLATPVHRLITDHQGRVIGAVAGGGTRLAARRGVILACGGFEADAQMQQQYWQAKPVLPAAFRGNTGDGIRMAQDVGADLWHMWHFHGSYGFRHPDPGYPFGVRTKRLPDWLPGEGSRPDVLMPWILVDRAGRRFMNEYDPYLQDTGHRPLERFCPAERDFAALPAWLIADETGRRRIPFGQPTSHERGVRWEWSPDNSREIELGILRRCNDVAALAAGVGVEAGRLAATIERWNAACDAHHDLDFGRPGTSMMPMRTPPFYYAAVWPIVSNTQGGPVHDADQRVLDPFGEPVPGLFAAGELGSVFGHLYLSGGNLAECLIGGRQAGRNAAAREETAP